MRFFLAFFMLYYEFWGFACSAFAAAAAACTTFAVFGRFGSICVLVLLLFVVGVLAGIFADICNGIFTVRFFGIFAVVSVSFGVSYYLNFIKAILDAI